MTVRLIHGDCLEVLPTLDAGSVDAVITDPPYSLKFMGKDWDNAIPGVRYWVEALRVAKPGAMLLAFGGTRTHHRLMCAIEDAGWEIRDVIMWVYGSGFPKSANISKNIDKAAGAEREVVGERIRPDGTTRPNAHNWSQKGMNDGWKRPWRDDPDAAKKNHLLTAPTTDAAQQWDGWGTALKPAYEPIIVAMKPLDGTFANNALTWGVAGLNIDGARVEGIPPSVPQPQFNSKTGQIYGFKTGEGRTGEMSRATGRWPANLIHDGSDEVTALFPQTKSGKASKNGHKRIGTLHDTADGWGMRHSEEAGDLYGDNGSAARFFKVCKQDAPSRLVYQSKASRKERNAGLEGMEERRTDFNSIGFDETKRNRHPRDNKMQNHHPTVKPLALMRYLCKLTATPTGGVVLDPFMGSGSTGCAAVLEGRSFIGVELDADYVEIARRRIEHCEAQDVQVELPLFEKTP